MVDTPSGTSKGEGTIRLNRLYDDTLRIDFGTTGVLQNYVARSETPLSVKKLQHNVFSITLQEKGIDNTKIAVMNISGKLIGMYSVKNNQVYLDGRSYTPGVYFARVASLKASRPIRIIIR